MSYFLAGHNKETGNWDILDRKVDLEECVALRDQLLEETDYDIINIVPELTPRS